MHSGDFNRHFSEVKLSICERKLFSVSGQQLDICGIALLNITIGSERKSSHKCELLVVNSSRKFIPLLGRDWLDILNPVWRNKLQIKTIEGEGNVEFDKVAIVDKIRADFPSVFTNIADGTIKHFRAELRLVDDARPIFCKPYTVPYGLRESVEQEIKRLCELGIIYSVHGHRRS